MTHLLAVDLVGGSTGVSNTIAALNLYPNGMDNEPDSYFVDNVSFHEYGLGLTEYNKHLIFIQTLQKTHSQLVQNKIQSLKFIMYCKVSGVLL